MKKIIETHFGLVLLLSCAAGMILPGMPDLPNVSAVITLAILMFVSCYKLRDGKFSDIRWRDVAVFYLLRYGVLPLLLWYIASWLVPVYAAGVFLQSVLPAAVASPAFTAIYGGAVAVSFAVVIASQLLTPALIPLQFALIGGEHVTPSPQQLAVTLVMCILLPMLVYAFTRRHQKSADWFYAQNKIISILLIAFVIALAVAKQREVILHNLDALLIALIANICCFTAYMLFGWFFAGKRSHEERIAFATCSGFNNAALGVSLALMHFAPEVVLFVAVGEIAWAILPMMMKWWLRWLGDSVSK
jgi:predicted Na+-dependent transporter